MQPFSPQVENGFVDRSSYLFKVTYILPLPSGGYRAPRHTDVWIILFRLKTPRSRSHKTHKAGGVRLCAKARVSLLVLQESLFRAGDIDVADWKIMYFHSDINSHPVKLLHCPDLARQDYEHWPFIFEQGLLLLSSISAPPPHGCGLWQPLGIYPRDSVPTFYGVSQHS